MDSRSEKTIVIVQDGVYTTKLTDFLGGKCSILTLPLPGVMRNRAAMIPSDISCFDWIIFPDIHAVEHFTDAIKERGSEIYELDLLNVAVLHECVAERLRHFELHADLIANSNEPEKVIGSLSEYCGGGELANQSILFVALPSKSTEAVTIGLQALGANVNLLPVYWAEPVDSAALTKVKTLAIGGGIDLLVLQSSAEVLDVVAYCDSETWKEAIVVALDEATAQTALECGLEVACVANIVGFDGLRIAVESAMMGKS
jgi:uroporphyrinogen-III synthase